MFLEYRRGCCAEAVVTVADVVEAASCSPAFEDEAVTEAAVVVTSRRQN